MNVEELEVIRRKKGWEASAFGQLELVSLKPLLDLGNGRIGWVILGLNPPSMGSNGPCVEGGPYS